MIGRVLRWRDYSRGRPGRSIPNSPAPFDDEDGIHARQKLLEQPFFFSFIRSPTTQDQKATCTLRAQPLYFADLHPAVLRLPCIDRGLAANKVRKPGEVAQVSSLDSWMVRVPFSIFLSVMRPFTTILRLNAPPLVMLTWQGSLAFWRPSQINST
jgi:hypothetical protein